MALSGLLKTPSKTAYDVVIVGGAMMGSSTAWFLTDNPDFNGSVLVVEKDPSYEMCSTSHTNSCMRQQFSNPLNVRISQFAADFVKNLRSYMGGDNRVPELSIQSYGYMYLADTERFADVLRASHVVQMAEGAGTRLMTPEQIAQEYPFTHWMTWFWAAIIRLMRGIGTAAPCLIGGAGLRRNGAWNTSILRWRP